MDLEIIQASEEHEAVLDNLARYYTYDCAEYVDADFDWYRCQADGTFNSGVSRYLAEPDSTVFLVKAAGEWAGFAVVERVKDVPGVDFYMGDFCVTRPWRRKGVGKHLARTLFDRYEGRWELCIWPANTPAMFFWERVVSEYTDGLATTTIDRSHRFRHGKRLCTHRFDSRGA